MEIEWKLPFKQSTNFPLNVLDSHDRVVAKCGFESQAAKLVELLNAGHAFNINWGEIKKLRIALTDRTNHCPICEANAKVIAGMREALDEINSVISIAHLDMGGNHRYTMSNGSRTIKAMAKVKAALAAGREA